MSLDFTQDYSNHNLLENIHRYKKLYKVFIITNPIPGINNNNVSNTKFMFSPFVYNIALSTRLEHKTGINSKNAASNIKIKLKIIVYLFFFIILVY